MARDRAICGFNAQTTMADDSGTRTPALSQEDVVPLGAARTEQPRVLISIAKLSLRICGGNTLHLCKFPISVGFPALAFFYLVYVDFDLHVTLDALMLSACTFGTVIVCF